MRLKIASRSSDLARIQAYQAARALRSVVSDLKIEFEFRASLGDQNLDVPLSGLQSKGVFTQDFFDDLKAGKFDLVVHSWKDLPTEPREGTRIAATLPRADLRDLLLVPNSVWKISLETGRLRILSSSPRRAHNLTGFGKFLPGGRIHLEFQNVRGNVPTRIEKMFSETSGLVLAKAALDRLLSAPENEFEGLQAKLRAQLEECRFMVLPVSINPPAAAQGALAIEVSEGRSDLAFLLDRVNHSPTFESVMQERNILESYGGGCHQKIGVAICPRPFGVWKNLRGLTDDGRILETHELTTCGKLPRATSVDHVFPLKNSDNSWFKRQAISVEQIDTGALWVARADAWPDDLESRGIVWTSGVESWRKLAARGVWVNGCAEGLGDEDPGLADLKGSLKWTKLTHADAPVLKSFNKVATYRLIPKPSAESPNLREKTHFFWMSCSSFRRARELFPTEVERGFHGCGPGLTYQFLKAQSLANPPQAYAGLESFLNEVLPP